jgi:hypothetical protein
MNAPQFPTGNQGKLGKKTAITTPARHDITTPGKILAGAANGRGCHCVAVVRWSIPADSEVGRSTARLAHFVKV